MGHQEIAAALLEAEDRAGDFCQCGAPSDDNWHPNCHICGSYWKDVEEGLFNNPLMAGPRAISNAFFPYREGYPVDLSETEIERDVDSPWFITIKEVLLTDAPGSAKPLCCYINEVIFYEHPHRVVDGNSASYGSVRTRLILEDRIEFEDEIFICFSQRVAYLGGSWVSLTRARRQATGDGDHV
ncbi:hypothetical protein [Pseudosulfitobacter pseudonitzschiae]|uniref:hypothetical protein n=1 Tax=Pseudosulfitobacter pseudonitzschiae TaxID=1402135 RepID=UPI001AF1FC5A|nr:hypothetical protein [Pseudosulfitobacter pseudonitzschiae]MBM1816249.1 hypothetical protein [Pseudosulfitobacter pseudonitzschiae]MBM1833748.1 hypothetical protein [Pseudosulfitobacter pseudonitzschiae]MBM1838614.1 hypothetical protein [Pseudosulfitobacter pseudonitzschiae]MBM1842962.1 hypothetical protein [Pseudosulfitobacter pseudonitzschiae]MBM1847828.1 hypothetical protein [Pseudosulfitobacter pseudonitzschiae]